MEHFVPNSVGDHLFKFLPGPRQALMRSLVDRNLVRQAKPVANVAHGARPSLVQPEKIRPRRIFLDDKHGIVKQPAETPWDFSKCAFHEAIKFSSREVYHRFHY
jgi:hypothetical protein